MGQILMRNCVLQCTYVQDPLQEYMGCTVYLVHIVALCWFLSSYVRRPSLLFKEVGVFVTRTITITLKGVPKKIHSSS